MANHACWAQILCRYNVCIFHTIVVNRKFFVNYRLPEVIRVFRKRSLYQTKNKHDVFNVYFICNIAYIKLLKLPSYRL